MPKKRRLGDLYVKGKPVKINDDSGQDPVEVWVQKLSPIEQEQGLRRSSVERAKYLAVTRDHESDIWQSVWADLHEFAATREQLLPIALREDLIRIRVRIEAEQADAEEWTKDNYLQGLSDAWEGTSHITALPDPSSITDADDGVEKEPEVHDEEGEQEPLKVSYMRGEEDPRFERAKVVADELARFNKECGDLFEGERDRLYRDYEEMDIEALREIAVEKAIEQNASVAMLTEFETQELFYATRQPEDHNKKYFGTRDEVLSLQPAVRQRLVAEYRSLQVEPVEGKDSPGTPGSSAPSDSSEPEATPNSSGPEA